MTLTQPQTKTNPYDEVPYVSFTLKETSPSYMQSCAAMFGIDATSPRKARILELGCAGGNNLINIAATYPESECVGVDLSQVQIAEGQKIIDDLNLKNISLQQRSIMDINEADGKFDYIIAHGVFSWVTKEVQEKILQLCNKNLSPNGVAYISYNTLPGWSTSNAVREMMKYHTRGFTDPAIQAAQARELLYFIKNGHKNFDKNYYTQMIEHEIDNIKDESDWYIMHEYLEESNIQFYFYQFMEMAHKVGLEYLCETNLSTMMIEHYPPETKELLSKAGSLINREQYIDFISNRRFRSTLLCHKDAPIKRNVTIEVLNGKYFTGRFELPEELKNYDYNSGKTLSFKLPNGLSTTTGNVIMILAFETFAEQKNKPASIEKIVSSIINKAKKYNVREEINEKTILPVLLPNLFKSIFARGIFVYLDEGEFTNQVSEKPTAFKLARYQATKQKWVSGLNHEVTAVDEFDKELLPLLDGTNDVNSIAKTLSAKFPDKNDIENFIKAKLGIYCGLGLLLGLPQTVFPLSWE